MNYSLPPPDTCPKCGTSRYCVATLPCSTCGYRGFTAKQIRRKDVLSPRRY